MTTNPPETTPARSPSPVVRTIEAVVGYAVGAAGLYWLLHDLPLRQFLGSLAGMNWGLLALGVVPTLVAYGCVAWQWQWMLRPVGSLSFGRTAQAVFAGRFANDALPVHVGYVVRALLAARWLGVSVAAVAPSLIMERLWDGVWLAVGTGALSLAVPLPADVVRARNILAVSVLGGVAALVAVVVLHRRPGARASVAAQTGVVARLQWLIGSVASGTGDIVRARAFPGVVTLALLKLALQAAAILIMLPACHIDLSLVNGLAVFAAGYLATCVPTTPAGAGVFQVLVVGILGYFGVGKIEAAGFSLVSFILVTLPPASVGFFALAKSGMTLRQVRNRGEWRRPDDYSARRPIVD